MRHVVPRIQLPVRLMWSEYFVCIFHPVQLMWVDTPVVVPGCSVSRPDACVISCSTAQFQRGMNGVYETSKKSCCFGIKKQGKFFWSKRSPKSLTKLGLTSWKMDAAGVLCKAVDFALYFLCKILCHSSALDAPVKKRDGCLLSLRFPIPRHILLPSWRCLRGIYKYGLLLLCTTFLLVESLSFILPRTVDMAKSCGSQMKKPCDCCKRYLDHLDERNQNMTCFLKRMTGNFKHNMIVLNRFLSHFKRELQGTIKLQSPNRCLYDVQVMHHYNKMVLGTGWESFLDVHDVNENDSLLFCHIEKESCFEVLIFDSDGCEKIFPCPGINKFPSIQERSVDSVNILSSSEHETTESSGSERSAGCDKGSHHPAGKVVRMALTSSSSDGSGKGTSSESESFESDDREMLAGTDYVMSRQSRLSKTQEKRVIAYIQEIQPEVTFFFVAIMRKSHVQPPVPYLAITKEYAVAHFLHEKTTVTLQRPGSSKKWHPQLYQRKDKKFYMLKGRKWLDFVRENNVQEGDICLLSPTSGAKKFTFTVHLLHATTTYSRHRRGGTSSRRVGASTNAEMDSEAHINEEPADGEHVSLGNGTHEISDKSLESHDSGCRHHPLYIITWKNHLSISQKRVVEEKVRAIQSKVPIYVAIMTKTMVGDSTCRMMLELGSRYAAAVDLPARGQTVVLQHMRKIWKTKMVIFGGRRRFLTGGWPQFSGDNGLRIGDICLFELKESEKELTMAVCIIAREEF